MYAFFYIKETVKFSIEISSVKLKDLFGVFADSEISSSLINISFHNAHMICLINLLLHLFSVPLPTYVLGPSNENSARHFGDLRGCELAENVIYLGE